MSTSVLRDVADTWHAFVIAGLASPTSAVLTELVALLLALSAAGGGHCRPAATLTTATATAALAAHLIH